MEFFLFWLVMALVVAIVAANKGRSGFLWFFYGLVIWPVALVHALVTPRSPQAAQRRLHREGRVKCPFCAEFIRPEARLCPFCRRGLGEETEGRIEAPNVGPASLASSATQKPTQRDNELPTSHHQTGSISQQRAGAGVLAAPDVSDVSAIVPFALISLIMVVGIVAYFGYAGKKDTGTLGGKGLPPTVSGSEQQVHPGSVVKTTAETASASASKRSDRNLILDAQEFLRKLGHDPGPIDGVSGPRTQAAVREFQAREGIAQTGEVTQTLVNRMENNITSGRFRAGELAPTKELEEQ